MKRKIVAAMLILALATSLTACRKTEASVEVEEASNIEEVNEEIPEQETESETTEVISGSTQEAEIQEETAAEEADIFTAEEGLEKVYLLLDAYSELIASSKEVEWNILDRCERLKAVGNIEPKTKDGFELNPTKEAPYLGTASNYVGINYFYNYVNNNGSYYDFTEYIESHNVDEILYENVASKEAIEKEANGDLTSNYSLFGEAIGCIPFIRQFESIEVADFKEGDECTLGPVSDIEVGYELTLSLDGENSGIIVLFDKDGNMLNLYTDDNTYDKFDYIFTFDAQ